MSIELMLLFAGLAVAGYAIVANVMTPHVPVAAKRHWSEVLGVAEDATPAEIDAAHADMRRRYHPPPADQLGHAALRLAEIDAAHREALKPEGHER